MKEIKFFKHILILLIFFNLNNCSLTTSGLIDMFNYSKTSADIISYANTKKTTSDHFISYVFNRDCSLARTLKLKAICKEIIKKDKRNVEYNFNKNQIKVIKYKNLSNIKSNYSKKKQPIVPSMAY